MGAWEPFKISLLLILFSALAALAQTGNLPVKLLSYNLHHGEGSDGRLDLARIGRIIQGVNPDYAGLQEVDSMTSRTDQVNQAAEYARLTGMKWAFARGIPLQGGAYGNAALTRFAFGKTVRIPLPGDEARVALITEVDLSGGQDPARSTVTFVNTHLMNGGAAEADRLESARLINAWITNPANGDPARPMILMGDMNASRGSGSMNEFLKQWQAADFDYGIDWVYFRPAARWRFVRAAKLTTGDAAVASDHEPVTQEMELIRPSVTSLLPGNGSRAAGASGASAAAAVLLRVGPGFLVSPGFPASPGKALGRGLYALDMRGRAVPRVQLSQGAGPGRPAPVFNP